MGFGVEGWEVVEGTREVAELLWVVKEEEEEEWGELLRGVEEGAIEGLRDETELLFGMLGNLGSKWWLSYGGAGRSIIE